jgi:hypothetical protein
MIQQSIDLALGRAFHPDPLDSTVSLARRFKQQTLIAISVYKDGMELVPVTFANGEPVFGSPEFVLSGTEDAESRSLAAFAERHRAKYCVINLTTGYSAVLSNRARRPESDEEALLLMRDNPERLLGESPAQGTRPSVAYHPTHNFAVVFWHKENDLNAVVALVGKTELGIARVQCGISSELTYVIDHFWPQVGAEAELILVDRGSIFYLPAAAGAFGRPLFDVGLKETPLKQALDERIGKLKASARIVLVDASGLGVAAKIRERCPECTIIQPLENEGQPYLRAVCGDQARLGYDLFPLERTARPFAPARLRFVPLVFWGAALVSAVVITYNTLQQTSARRQTANLQAQTMLFGEGMKHQTAVRKELEAHAKTATAMCDWLLISPPTEPLLAAITEEIESATAQGLKENRSVAQLDGLSLTRQEGQPQMRLVLVILGDAQAANRIFQRISALFGRLGYSTVDLKQTLIPQGFRYEHLLNMPQATTG